MKTTLGKMKRLIFIGILLLGSNVFMASIMGSDTYLFINPETLWLEKDQSTSFLIGVESGYAIVGGTTTTSDHPEIAEATNDYVITAKNVGTTTIRVCADVVEKDDITQTTIPQEATMTLTVGENPYNN